MVQTYKNQKNKVHKVKHNVPILTNNNTQCIEIKKNEQSLECPICYEKIENKNYIVTKCNHTFCNDCLFKSLTDKPCCPICRQEIFNFTKIKDLTLEDVSYLEDRSRLFRNTYSLRLTNELIKIMEYSLESNDCPCTNDETKQALNSYFKCNNFQNKLYRFISSFLNNGLRVFSVYCYENLYNWLKNETN